MGVGVGSGALYNKPTSFSSRGCKRRVNQSSFVLMRFALFAFSRLCIVSVLSVFLMCLPSYIFQIATNVTGTVLKWR